MKKKDLIIIPGASYLKSKSYISNIFNWFYSFFNMAPHSDYYYKVLIKRLSKDYKNIYFINYNRKFFNLFDYHNFKKIAKIISNIENEYDALAVSFGGYLIQSVLNMISNYPRKIILVSSVNIDTKIKFPKKTRVINVYSKDDIFIIKINKLIGGKFGGQILKNAKNISLEELSHSDMETNAKIKKGKSKGLRTFDFIERLLNSKLKNIQYS